MTNYLRSLRGNEMKLAPQKTRRSDNISFLRSAHFDKAFVLVSEGTIVSTAKIAMYQFN
jgi:hypothetical protein